MITSYKLGRYFIIGDQLISRRLEVILAIIFIIGFVSAKQIMIEWTRARDKSVFPNLISFVLVASIAITASYSLGPDSNSVSSDEYAAMRYIWSQEKTSPIHCVIADTYPLLALEAISAKQIVGGGFPIDSNFSQSEREVVWNLAKVDVKAAEAAGLNITGAAKCWVINPTLR